MKYAKLLSQKRISRLASCDSATVRTADLAAIVKKEKKIIKKRKSTPRFRNPNNQSETALCDSQLTGNKSGALRFLRSLRKKQPNQPNGPRKFSELIKTEKPFRLSATARSFWFQLSTCFGFLTNREPFGCARAICSSRLALRALQVASLDQALNSQSSRNSNRFEILSASGLATRSRPALAPGLPEPDR